MSFFWMFSGGTMFIIFKVTRSQYARFSIKCLHFRICWLCKACPATISSACKWWAPATLQVAISTSTPASNQVPGRLLAGVASSHPPLNLPPVAQYLVVHLLSCLVFASFALLPSVNAPPLAPLLILFLVFGLSWGLTIQSKLLISKKQFLSVCPYVAKQSKVKAALFGCKFLVQLIQSFHFKKRVDL